MDIEFPNCTENTTLKYYDLACGGKFFFDLNSHIENTYDNFTARFYEDGKRERDKPSLGAITYTFLHGEELGVHSRGSFACQRADPAKADASVLKRSEKLCQNLCGDISCHYH